ncbi:MAG TPA: NifU N-terminal domain-containing protein [Acidimicrobiales bacterium]|nr:NifU N-terminal domain-containing protein [Acidimicrobiales bacterium]
MAEVLDIATTPNPDAMKYTVDRHFDEMFNIVNAEDADQNAFAKAVFTAGGVASVFGTANFVTITRTPDGDWGAIEAAVRAAAADHL